MTWTKRDLHTSNLLDHSDGECVSLHVVDRNERYLVLPAEVLGKFCPDPLIKR